MYFEDDRSHDFRGFRGRRVITRRCYESKKHTQTTTVHDSNPMNKNYTKSSLKHYKPYKLQSNSYECDLVKHEVLGNHSKTPTCLQCDVRLKNLTFGFQAIWNQHDNRILDALHFNMASYPPLFMNWTRIYNIRARKCECPKPRARKFMKQWVWRDVEEEMSSPFEF